MNTLILTSSINIQDAQTGSKTRCGHILQCSAPLSRSVRHCNAPPAIGATRKVYHPSTHPYGASPGQGKYLTRLDTGSDVCRVKDVSMSLPRCFHARSDSSPATRLYCGPTRYACHIWLSRAFVLTANVCLIRCLRVGLSAGSIARIRTFWATPSDYPKQRDRSIVSLSKAGTPVYKPTCVSNKLQLL